MTATDGGTVEPFLCVISIEMEGGRRLLKFLPKNPPNTPDSL